MKCGLALLLPLFATSRASAATFNVNNEPSILKLEEFRALGEKPLIPHNVRPHRKIFNHKREEDLEINVQAAHANSLLDICKKDHHFIEASGDLHVLGIQCGNISGTITFVNYQDSIIDFGDLESIGGDLIIENSASVVKIQGNKLRRIGGAFIIRNMTSLVAVELPYLKHIHSIEWKVVPILTTAHMDDDIEDVTSIVISDSSLATITGFQKVKMLEIFDINNNRYLESIKANVKSVTKQVRVHANAKELELELPELISAKNITIRDTSLIDLSKLEKVDNSLEFIENQLTKLTLPNLRSIGGTLGIMQNNMLSSADFGNVTDIQGGLVIANNTRLEKIDFLQKLRQIGGAIYFEGRFQDTEFPVLKMVKGSAYIKSNSVILDCNKWTTPVNGRAIIRGGKVSCISGRKQKTQNISEDGKVLNETETGGNGEEYKENGKNGLLSRLTSSGTSAFASLNIVSVVGISLMLSIIHVAIIR
ncbi:related to Sporulation-specific protein 22 [Zygosaccharomyces bailii]|nr:related to Sporulation-specific protein 22 [Zygosaccharomyces bailii]